MARSFRLTVGLGLLTVNWLGLFYLRFKFGFVFFTYGSPRPGNRFGFFYLLVCFAYGSPLQLQSRGPGTNPFRDPHLGALERRTVSKKTSTIIKKDASKTDLYELSSSWACFD